MDDVKLIDLRKEIDLIDTEILELLKKRLQVAREIGKAKGSSPVYDPKREEEVLNRLRKQAPDIDGDQLARIYGEIMALSRSVQKQDYTGDA